jgi:hypothetical protein
VAADTCEVVLHSSSLREPLPLSLHHRPLVATFALFEGERIHAVMDPSALEERACSGCLLVMCALWQWADGGCDILFQNDALPASQVECSQRCMRTRC